MERTKAEDLFIMKWPSDPQVSPDGQSVVFVVKHVVEEEGKKSYSSRIWMYRDGKVFQFTSGSKTDSSPKWSPDGRLIAFLSDRGKDKMQVYVIPAQGGEARQVTHFKDGCFEFAWAPDGKRLAVVTLAGEEPQEPKTDVRLVTRLRYKLNGKGFLSEKTAQIFVVDLDGLSQVQITDGVWDSREPAWSPDGSQIAFISARFPEADLSSIRDVYVVNADGKNLRRITNQDAALSSPSWSPDGKWIACYGHDNAYRGATVPGICLVEVESGKVNFITRKYSLGVGEAAGSDVVQSPLSRPAWASDSSSVYFSALYHGRTHIYRISVSGGEPEQITGGDCVVYGWSKAGGSPEIACCATSPALIGDVFLLSKIGGSSAEVRPLEGFKGYSVKRLTRLNEKYEANTILSVPEEVWVTSKDGTKIQTWVMKPVGIQEGKKYPLILEIHGGPHAAYGYSFFHEFQFLASRGYGVIYGNPRGSTGYGQEFVAATHHDWGGKDYMDIMAIADYALTLPWVDSSRMGVTGGSYGGYMTNWIVGHTRRFKAAVSARSTSNRFSQFGTSDAAYTNGDFEFDGDPWDNPMAYLERSPIMYVRNVETPIMLLHSEEDLRCPISQAEEFFVALKKLNKEVCMVRFPGENHELSRSGRPDHRITRLEYIAAWFDRYLNPVKTDYDPAPDIPEKPRVRLP